MAVAPNGVYQLTSGTSIAAAHASGVAALLLAVKPKLAGQSDPICSSHSGQAQ
jgi:subtilisin family serine protease